MSIFGGLGSVLGGAGGFLLGGPMGALAGSAALGGIGSGLDQDAVNQANAQQAQNQMDFQRDMSGTSYQRAMADMKKAGLNPMLAIQNGGASTPGGASAQFQNNTAAQQITGGLANAVEAKQRGDMNNSSIDLNNSSKQLLQKKTETEASNALAAKANATQAQLEAQIKTASMPAELQMAPYKPYIDAAGKVIGMGANAAEGFSAFKAMKYIGQKALKNGQGLTNDGTKFNINSGEVIKP